MADQDINTDLDLDAFWRKQQVFFSMNAADASKRGEVAIKPDLFHRFRVVVDRFPKLREMLSRSSAVRELIATPGALKAFVDGATDGARGIDDLFLNANYRDIFSRAGSNAHLARELDAMSQLRDELERFKHGSKWSPGCHPLPVEPNDFESEAFITHQTNEDNADAFSGNKYLPRVRSRGGLGGALRRPRRRRGAGGVRAALDLGARASLRRVLRARFEHPGWESARRAPRGP